MGRRRKGNGRPFGDDSVRTSKNNDGSRLAINTYEDVPDSEDEFHIQRDEIRLDEGTAAKRLRQAHERDAELELSDEEVLAISEDDEGTDDVETDESDESQTEDLLEQNTPSSRPRRRRKPLGKPLQSSDSEEVAKEEEEEEAWGTSRKDYYNADVIETEQDALDEEKEARLLQQKQLERMTDADYGLDEIDWEAQDDAAEAGNKSRTKTEVLPKLQISDSMTVDERMKILRARYPEFEPLAEEFVELQARYVELQERAKGFEVDLLDSKQDRRGELSVPVTALKHRTLAAYLSAISMYFVILTSGEQEGEAAAMPPDALQRHSVMSTLVECRDLWTRIRDLPEQQAARNVAHSQTNGHSLAREHSSGEIVQLENQTETARTAKEKKIKKSKAEKALETKRKEAEERRQSRIEETEASLADLSALTKPSKSAVRIQQNGNTAADSDSDIGEQNTLTAAELADKARRKKSLRFYTSQIAQKSNKRTAAGRDAGGDDDLPYRERWKEKQARLQAEAEKRGKQMRLPGADLAADSAAGSEGEPTNAQRGTVAIPAAANDDDDYYDLVAAQSKKRKADKAARTAANGMVERIRDDAALEDDGRRNISYEIEKNKGLMNKRKKEQRNPRVKKRKKFEEKKKKLGSIKPVWKGGEGRGGYGGELTGIKTGVTKGIRL